MSEEETTIPSNKVFDEDGIYRFLCPHCKQLIEVEKTEVNCKIFRHGYHIVHTPTGIVLQQQMNPHTPKEICDKLRESGSIIGCGKPFRFVFGENGGDNFVEPCGYI